MKRTIIIGDVHGMAVELQSLLDKLVPNENDTFVFVGDLVDGGPESVEAVRMVRELSEKFDVVVLEGNHEVRHRKFRKKHTDAEVDDLAEKGHPRAVTTKALSEEDIAFMDSFVLFNKIEEHEILVVHGGIPGNMTKFPDTLAEIPSMSRKEQEIFSKIIYTRRVNAQTGGFLRLKEATEADPFWADLYGGRFGHVVFGHQPFVDGVRKFPHATGIDTGAVFGGSLTAMVLDGESRTFVLVPSRGKFRNRLSE